MRFASEAAAQLIGVQPEALAGTDLLRHVHPQDVEELRGFLTDAGQRDEGVAPLVVRLGDGSRWRHCELRGQRLEHTCGPRCPMHPDGAKDEVVVNARDVSEERALRKQLTWRALHDDLTELPNRTLFLDRIGHELAATRRAGDELAVVLLDLDDFKAVNDTYGHFEGDRLLVEVASRLARVVREGDTAARLGGDEFGLLLPHLQDRDEAERIAEHALSALGPAFEIGALRLHVGASAGIAIGGRSAFSQDLLRQADVAMYVAKSRGGGRAVRYEPEAHGSGLQRLELVGELDAAVQHGEIEAWYQPRVQLATGRVVGFEALARWRHPAHGIITPDDFLPLAEETGLVVELGGSILRQSCAWLQARHRRGAALGLDISVNLSARQLAGPGIVTEVNDALDASGLAPDRLVLEITESVLMHDLEDATRRLRQLKELGVRLAVDDFGTGYSSLAYLQRFPVDVLKVDQAFVARLSGANGSSDLVRAIIDLGRALRLELTAEGVERHEQAQQLQLLGCDDAQGFLFGKAVPAGAAAALVEASPGRLAMKRVARPPESGRATDADLTAP